MIQVDYNFVSTDARERDKATIITAADVQTAYPISVMVPAKGLDNYCEAELKRFIYEIGRTHGTLQYDQEPALKALCHKVLESTGGLSGRATPKDWKQAHGAVGATQRSFHGQLKALRLQVQDNYGIEMNAAHLPSP